MSNMNNVNSANDNAANDIFLRDQLEIYRDIKNGEKTWQDLNDFRQGYGLPVVTVDSIRRSFMALGEYDKAGWVAPASPAALKIGSQRECVETNFKTGATTSDKIIGLLPEEINKAEILLKAHGFNPDEFELVSAKNSKWEQGSKDGLKTLYSSKITIKPRTGIEPVARDLSEYFKDYKGHNIPAFCECEKNSCKDSKESLLLPLYDFHWGRLPDVECAEYFSLQEVKRMLMDNITTYIEKFKTRKFKKVYLVVGQDYFNSSSTGYTTSQSHIQSNATDVATMYRTGTELLIDIINSFANVGESIYVIGSLGNHAKFEEMWLFSLLKAYYKDEPRIIVNDGTAPRKYIEYGASCIGLGHLDKEKDRIFGLMQSEVPYKWARTSTHMFIAGHFHHLTVESKQGVELWRVPSPTLPDRWTVEQGYVQNIPRTMAFVFDHEEGLIETHFVSV